MIPTETRRRMCHAKKRYTSKGLAERARIQNQRKYGKPFRVYACPVAG